jgi:iron complex outermembrane receptor protein
MSLILGRRALLLSCTALASSIGLAAVAYGSSASAAEASVATLPEVVVTAQRREQNVQDVPIAVTALTQATMAVNRIATVNDLNLLAPGFTEAPSIGGTQIPSFTMRGRTSYGVVPGSDKAISMYVDGVYISSARGSIFNLPDISQIDVLRGPQGTLFGRNATAGAISITTRDPTGRFGVQQDFTVGNHAAFRSRTTIDTPEWHGLSAYISYVHDQKNGDVRNLGAGTVWDYSNATTPEVPKTQTSPKYLGSRDANSIFVAVKYQPTDWFRSVFKYDYSKDRGSDEATVPLFFPASHSIFGVPLIPPTLYPSALRPDEVNNAISTPRRQTSDGMTLTSTIEKGGFTIKNIAGYRQTFLMTTDQLDGLGGLQVPTGLAPPLPTAVPFTLLAITNFTRSRQWSDELQTVYRSKVATVTVGGLLFQTKDQNGAIPGLENNIAFSPGLTIPPGKSVFYNKGQSIAAYAQVEFHVTSTLDIVGGIRETKDWKSGTQVLPIILDPVTHLPDPTKNPPASFNYTANKPTYLIGVNYKPMEDLLLYGKYSTGFVSGGAVAGIPFAPETVDAWEGGLKGEFFDRHLRTNVAVYHAVYQHLQTSQGGGTFPDGPLKAKYPYLGALGTFVLDQGGEDRTYGVEFEGTLLVARGLTTGANVSYNHTVFTGVDPNAYLAPGIPPIPSFLPEWTVSLWGGYEKTFDNGLKGSLRLDANWRSPENLTPKALDVPFPYLTPYNSIPSTWVVNGRAVLSGFKLAGVGAEVAIWGKNIGDDRHAEYILGLTSFGTGSANFVPARSFGLDLNFKY